MNLIPFNLEKAKAGEPIQTRDGRKAKFIAHVPELQPDYRVVTFINAQSSVRSFTEEGRVFRNLESEDDLFMAPKMIHGWVNIQDSYSGVCCSYVYPTLQEANENARPNRIACIEINVPEGHGLEDGK